MKKITADMAGCWIHSGHNLYMGLMIQELAQKYGRKETVVEDTDSDLYYEAWCDAIDYLDALAPEGYCVDTNECGDFGLWDIKEWGNDDVY